MKPKITEVGFTYRCALYIITFFPGNPVDDRLFVPVEISIDSESAGRVEAFWDTAEGRFTDAAPNDAFIYQPEQGKEQEELFSGLILEAQRATREALEMANAAEEDLRQAR